MLGSQAARRLLKVDVAFRCDPYTSLARWRTSRTPEKEKLPLGKFRVSPRNVLCGVSLRGCGPGGVGVDERVEGASRTLPRLGLLDVDQVDHVAPIRPLVEPHGGVALFGVALFDELD